MCPYSGCPVTISEVMKYTQALDSTREERQQCVLLMTPAQVFIGGGGSGRISGCFPKCSGLQV